MIILTLVIGSGLIAGVFVWRRVRREWDAPNVMSEAWRTEQVYREGKEV